MRNMCSNLDGSKLTLTSCLALSLVWRYTIQKLQIWGIIRGSSTVQQSFAKGEARKEWVAGQHVLKLLLQQHDLPLKLVETSSLLDWCYCKTGRLRGLRPHLDQELHVGQWTLMPGSQLAWPFQLENLTVSLTHGIEVLWIERRGILSYYLIKP